MVLSSLGILCLKEILIKELRYTNGIYKWYIPFEVFEKSQVCKIFM